MTIPWAMVLESLILAGARDNPMTLKRSRDEAAEIDAVRCPAPKHP